MLPAKPSSGLVSILSSGVLRSGKSFRSIMNQATQGLPIDQKRIVERTLLRLNTNPDAVVTNIMSKQAINALSSAGMLKGKYQTNAGMAIGHVQKMHAAGATTMTPAQKKEQEHAEASKEARFKDIARERREAAEGHLSEEEIHTHEPAGKSVHDTSVGMKDWQAAKVGIGQVLEEKNRPQASVTHLPTDANNEPDEPLPLVEMNIG